MMWFIGYDAPKDLTPVMDAIPASENYVISLSRVSLIAQEQSR